MRDILILTFALTACDTADTGDTADTADTGDTGDTGETGEACGTPMTGGLVREQKPVTFTDVDDTCDMRWDDFDRGAWPEGAACSWGYVWLRSDTQTLALSLDLPEADQTGGADVHYTLPVGGEAALELVDLGEGSEEADYWSCSDYYESVEGKVWTGVGGRVTVEARYVCEAVDEYCSGADQEFHAVVRLEGVGLEHGDECRELDDVELRVVLGYTECGG